MKIEKSLQNKVLDFLENVEIFYQQKINITTAISTNQQNFNRHFTTFGYTAFILKSIGARFSGARIMFNGEQLYYEVSLDNLVEFSKLNEQAFLFVEQYSGSVFRKTTIEFTQNQTP